MIWSKPVAALLWLAIVAGVVLVLVGCSSIPREVGAAQKCMRCGVEVRP